MTSNRAIPDAVSAALAYSGLDATLDLYDVLHDLSQLMVKKPAWLAHEDDPNGALRGAVFEGFCRRWCAEVWRPRETMHWGCRAVLEEVELFTRTVDVGYASASVGFGEFKISNVWLAKKESFKFLQRLADRLVEAGILIDSVVVLSLSSAAMLRNEAVRQRCNIVEILGINQLRDIVDGKKVVGLKP